MTENVYSKFENKISNHALKAKLYMKNPYHSMLGKNSLGVSL